MKWFPDFIGQADLKDLTDFFVSRPLYPPWEGSLKRAENAELNLFSPLSVSDETDKTQSPAAKKRSNKLRFTPFCPVCYFFRLFLRCQRPARLTSMATTLGCVFGLLGAVSMIKSISTPAGVR